LAVGQEEKTEHLEEVLGKRQTASLPTMALAFIAVTLAVLLRLETCMRVVLVAEALAETVFLHHFGMVRLGLMAHIRLEMVGLELHHL
jgi:hypothetical protein